MRAFVLSALTFFVAEPALAQCRQEPIEKFFPEFAASIAVQESRVSDMVFLGAMNPDAQPEPKLETVLVPKSEVVWPVVPNMTIFQRNGGTVQYVPVAGDKNEYLVTLKGDNGYLVSLYFVGPCWELRSIMNKSL